MLSAIAARKAAQATKRQLEQTDDGDIVQINQSRSPIRQSSSSEGDLSPKMSLTSSSEQGAPSNKRKARGLDHPSTLLYDKKIKRPTNTDVSRKRYFEAQDHVSGGHSPCKPFLDSSEDEGENKGWNDTANFQQSIQEPTFEKSHTLHRTFVPIQDVNTFQLNNCDVKALHIPNNIAESNGTLIFLPPGESLTFVGTASIILLHGAVEILGTQLLPSPRPHCVFSPRSSPVASIVALELNLRIKELSVSLLYPRGSEGGVLPERIQKVFRMSDSALLIQHLHTGVEGLEKVCRTFEGIFDVDSDMRESGAEHLIGIEGFHPVDPHSRPHPQLQPFVNTDSWKEALDAIVPPLSSPDEVAHVSPEHSFVALVKGPKKCGKSTFARTLLNRLTTRYQHVAFLECDLGQSELTPGGMVSLHVISYPIFGPPFTHPILPYRAHYIGHTTPRSTPSHYLSCIQALVQTYRLDVQHTYQETSNDGEYSDEDGTQENRAPRERDYGFENYIPLVVNTQGWIKGLGGDLLRKIEEMVEATDVFTLDTQTQMIPRQRFQSSTTRVHVVRPILTSPLAAYYTPADHRQLSILSYFHCIPPNRPREGTTWTTDLPLCARPPWEVDCTDAIDRIVLVGAGFEDIVSHELNRAINCGVVALVCDEDPATVCLAPEPENGLFSWPYVQGAPAPSPSSSYCLGLALIRGVEATTYTLHLLTPVSPASLQKCRVLVKGELELPVWGMLDFRDGYSEGVAGVKWGHVPYLQSGGEGSGAIGSSRRRVRKNLMRRGQM